MSKKAAELAGQMAQMLEVIGVLEERIAELKKMAGGKKKRRGAAAAAADPNQPARAPRPPNRWIVFTQRVEGLARGAGLPFAKAVDSKKFCKELKDRKGYEWTDDDILAARRDWDPPTPVQSVGEPEEDRDAVSICPTCKGVIESDAEAHRACVRSVAAAAQAAGADPMKAVDAWSESVSRVILHTSARPVALNSPFVERSRTPLRRPSGTAPLSIPQLQRPPPLPTVAALNTPSEEMVMEDME